jgi:DNA-binding NtrC family response regulator
MQWPVVESRNLKPCREKSALPAEKRPGTFVLVEDEESVAETIMDLLLTMTEQVVHFPTADSAYQWISSRPGLVSGVLSDVHLKHSMPGVELKALLAQEYPDMVVFLYSGVAKESIERQFNCSLNDEFLSKPVTAEQLNRLMDLI